MVDWATRPLVRLYLHVGSGVLSCNGVCTVSCVGDRVNSRD